MDIKVDDILSGKNTQADAMLEQKKAEDRNESEVLNLMKRVKELEEQKVKFEEEIERKTREIKGMIEEIETEKELILEGVEKKVRDLGRNVSFDGIGKAGFRKQPDRIDVDEKKFISFAMSKGLDKYYKTEPKIKKKELNKAIKLDKKGNVFLDGNKVNDMVFIVPQSPKFNWQVVI